MFSKEDRKNVEILNAALGTKHRSKPYDLNNAADLKQALTLAVAAYRDYCNYTLVLSGLDEDFDESIEHYDIVSWINMGTEKADNLTADCVGSLGITLGLFDELKERAKENFTLLLNAVLSTPPSTQKAVLGQAYKISADEIGYKIAELFDILDEIEYTNPIPENFDIFIKLIDEQWDEYKLT